MSQPISVPSAAEVSDGDFSAVGLANGVARSQRQSRIRRLVLPTLPSPTFFRRRCGSSLTGAAGSRRRVRRRRRSARCRTARSSPTSKFRRPASILSPSVCSNTCPEPAAAATFRSRRIKPIAAISSRFASIIHSATIRKLAIYYYFDDDNTLDPFAKFQASGATTGNFPGVYATRNQQINVTHTSTIGATSVNEARFSYFREGQLKFDTPTRVGAIQASCGSGAASAFCFTGTADTPLFDDCRKRRSARIRITAFTRGLGPTKEGVPFIDVGGGFSIGNNFNGQLPQTGNTFQFSDNFSKIIGNHSLKFGGDVRYQKFDQLLYFDVNGDMQFLSTAERSNG